MIQIRQISSSLTEIYVGGGGKYLTESYPTNFHTFATRRTLTAGDDAGNYREVTETEKAAIEEADAKWVRPPQSFIDRWNKRCIYMIGQFNNKLSYGKYNETTGFFELNGFTDIGYNEALEIDRLAINPRECNNISYWFMNLAQNCRTLFPLYSVEYAYVSANEVFRSCRSLQLIRFVEGNKKANLQLASAYAMFDNCRELETIDVRIIFSTKTANTSNMFRSCNKLTEVTIVPRRSISFSDSPLLSEASMTYMIANGEAGITLTLHPDAYARVTDEMFALAAERQITIAST